MSQSLAELDFELGYKPRRVNAGSAPRNGVREYVLKNNDVDSFTVLLGKWIRRPG